MPNPRTLSRQQRRAAARAADPARGPWQHPEGPRWMRRNRRRQANRPPNLPPTSTRRLRAHSRPHRSPLESEHRDGSFGIGLLRGLGSITEAGTSRYHVYGGTVAWPVVRDRRRAAKDARVARRTARRAGR